MDRPARTRSSTARRHSAVASCEPGRHTHDHIGGTDRVGRERGAVEHEVRALRQKNPVLPARRFAFGRVHHDDGPAAATTAASFVAVGNERRHGLAARFVPLRRSTPSIPRSALPKYESCSWGREARPAGSRPHGASVGLEPVLHAVNMSVIASFRGLGPLSLDDSMSRSRHRTSLQHEVQFQRESVPPRTEGVRRRCRPAAR